MPVKFRSDTIIVTSNFATSRLLHEIGSNPLANRSPSMSFIIMRRLWHDDVMTWKCFPHCWIYWLSVQLATKFTPKLRITVLLCVGNPQVVGGFPSLRAANVENVSMSRYHHVLTPHYRDIGAEIKKWIIHVNRYLRQFKSTMRLKIIM